MTPDKHIFPQNPDNSLITVPIDAHETIRWIGIPKGFVLETIRPSRQPCRTITSTDTGTN